MDRPAHLNQAAHNETFFGEVDHAERSDWAVTVLFYAAVHYVDAHLAKKSENPGNHYERNRCILDDPTAKGVFKQYERLRQRSRAARYDGARYTLPEIDALKTGDLKQIKTALS